MALATGPEVETDPQKTEVPFEVNTNPLAPSDALATTPPLRNVLPVNVVFAEVVSSVNVPVFATVEPIAPAVSQILPARKDELFAVETLN